MIELLALIFIVSLSPLIAITVFFNKEWNKYLNPITRQKQMQFNVCALLAMVLASTLFAWLLTSFFL